MSDPSAVDDQWRRWEVFKQDAERRPHQAVGSVHAADAEHALLTARTVFVRRPSAVSLWVAPAESILSWTAEQLATRAAPARQEVAGPRAHYQVFVKSSHRHAMTFADHRGEVTAADPEAALAEALESFGDPPVLALWLVPEEAIARSAAADADSWFDPAEDKTYKQQSAYGAVRASPRRP